MRIQPDQYSQLIWERGEKHAEAVYKAEKAAAIRKLKRATAMLKFDGSQAYREMMVETDDDYQKAVDDEIRASLEVNLSKAKLEAMRVDYEVWRSRNATERAEMMAR